MNDNIYITGVLEIVCSRMFDTNVFQQCLFASKLMHDGKVWCELKNSAEWHAVGEDGTPVPGTLRQVATYVVVLVADLHDVPMSEAKARWEKFCKCVGEDFPREEKRMRSVRIASANAP